MAKIAKENTGRIRGKIARKFERERERERERNFRFLKSGKSEKSAKNRAKFNKNFARIEKSKRDSGSAQIFVKNSLVCNDKTSRAEKFLNLKLFKKSEKNSRGKFKFKLNFAKISAVSVLIFAISFFAWLNFAPQNLQKSNAEGVPSSFSENPDADGAVNRMAPYDCTNNCTNTFYAFVKSGESLEVSAAIKDFVFAAGISADNSKSILNLQITSPSGAKTVWKSPEVPASADTLTKWRAEIAQNPAKYSYEIAGLREDLDGIWKIEFIAADSAARNYEIALAENIRVISSENAEITGRVFANAISLVQKNNVGAGLDFSVFALSDAGYKYQIKYFGYLGAGSVISANSSGNVAENDTCISAYQSQGNQIFATEDAPLRTPAQNCAKYRLFYSEPAVDLPEIAESADGEMLVAPKVLTAENIISNLTFSPNNSTKFENQAGNFVANLNPNFSGNFNLEIDANGNGKFDDEKDVKIAADARGGAENSAIKIPFDGLDSAGEIIPANREISARISVSKGAEIHIVMNDLEGLAGGLEMTLLNGENAGDQTIYWDDSSLQTGNPVVNQTPQISAKNGVNSAGGVHSWNFAGNSWGDNRKIDNWAFQKISANFDIQIPAREENLQNDFENSDKNNHENFAQNSDNNSAKSAQILAPNTAIFAQN